MLSQELFVKHFTGLCEMYGKPFTQALADIYYEALKDMADDDFKRGVVSCIQSRKYTTMPMPGDIRGDYISIALSALDKAESAASRYGAYRSLQFDDPVIHMVIESMGGWPLFCQPEDGQDWHWHQKEFVRLYETFAKHARSCSPELPGISARDNAAHGIEWQDKVIMIGEGSRSFAWKRLSELIGSATMMKSIDR